MLRFYADGFCRATGIFPQVWQRLNNGIEPDRDSMDAYFFYVKYLLRECERLSLPVSLKAAKTIESYIKSGAHTFQEMGRQLVELHTRVIDELEGNYFLMVPTHKVACYETPLKGWDVQVTAFPSIQGDLEEAQKCYALNRSTACVFHLMRALEIPLKALSTELGIVRHLPSWEAYLSVMATNIATKFPDKNKAHGDKRAYFTALEGQLRAVKTAWRNPTMHDMAKIYTDEQAHELIVLVRGFMREAAEELSEPTLKG